MSQTAAMTAPAEQLGPPERLHPLYLLTGLGQSVRGAWGMLAGGAILAAQGRWWIAVLLVVGSAVFSTVALFVRWLKLEYRVGPHEIRIDSGFLNRTSRAIPFDRVTDVDLEQGPIHRLFGLARVKLETGGSAGGKEEEGVLHTISLERAEALREHIRARKGLAPIAAAAESESEAPPLFEMDSKRVLTAGLFNFSLAVLAGLFGVTQTLGDAMGFDPFKQSFWIDLFARSGPLRDLVIAHQIGAIIAGSILLVLIGVGTGMVRTVLREHGFRLDRTETGFRRRRGLLTLTDVSIPAKRVQAAILASGPMRRAFGWWELKLQSLSQDGGKGDHVVAPLADELEAEEVLRSLQWPIGPGSDPWRPISRAHVTSYAALVGPPALLPIAIPFMGAAGLTVLAYAPFLGLVAVAWLAGAPILIGTRWLSWRRTRYAVSPGTLFVETGWWRHRRSIVPARKIQSIDIAESWWTRLFGICTLRLGVAGGSGFSDHHVPALSRPEAEALRAELLA
ncbi:PH domain-containing protein [Sphingomonas sp. NSE70-1]|uniref:PH domain-containing protein n=1 Tax=Sphingomonas caseinilyticus TaxID=2908205 RepID=A0ABT0RU50_9SPHN|nr:PH domain-containing protein [Sphingomonas caseinilyticus]MCL6698451.1 PH domain-containing protein [Sphingomonas caseinilyticus]